MSILAASVLAEVNADTSKGERALANFDGKLRATAAGGARELGPLRSALGGIENAAKIAGAGLGGMAAAFGVGALGGMVSQLGHAVVQFGQMGAAAEEQADAFQNVAAAAGVSANEILDATRRASEGMVSNADLVAANNQAIMMGAVSNAQQAAQLMEIAKVRSDAVGMGVGEAYSALAEGIGRVSERQLYALGINLDMEAANAAYAASLGKTADKLSETEKQQALYNAVVADSQPILDAAGGAGMSNADKMDRFAASSANLKDAFAQMMAGPTAAAMDKLADGIDAINKRAAEGDMAHWTEDMNAAGANVSETWGRYLAAYNEELAQWQKAVETFAALNPGKDVGEFRPNLEGFNELGAAWDALSKYVKDYNTAAAKLGAPQYDLEGMKRGVWETTAAAKATQEVADANVAAAAAIGATAAAAAQQANAFDAVGKVIGGYTDDLQGMVTALAGQVGVGQALAMFDDVQARLANYRTALEQVGLSQAQIAIVMDGVAADVVADWQRIVDGSTKAVGAHDAAAAAMAAAGVTAHGLGVDLDFAGVAGWGAKAGIEAAGGAAVRATGGFWGLVDAAVAARQAMADAALESGISGLRSSYLGAVGTLGAGGAQAQYEQAAAGMTALNQGLHALGATTNTVDFAMAAYADKMRGTIQNQVEADRVAHDTLVTARAASAGTGRFAAAASGAGSSAATLKGKFDDLSGKLQGMLDKVPGLTGTSEVTEEQMRLSDLGVPQNFADDYLRRLTDEVLHGVDWQGVDIKDAAQRAGIDQNLPAQTILEMFKNAWGNSSLFANAQNLDLINMDAVKADLLQQQQAATGKANLMALFGIGDESAVGAVASLGLSVQQGLSDWLGQNGFGEQGAAIAASLGAGLASSPAVGEGIPGGLDTYINSDGGKAALSAFGVSLGDAISPSVHIKPTVDMPTIPNPDGTGGATDGTADGTGAGAGAQGSRATGGTLPPVVSAQQWETVFQAAARAALARNGATTVTINGTVREPHDVALLAKEVARELRRHA